MFVPADPWLSSLLNLNLYLGFGLFENHRYENQSKWEGLSGLLSLAEPLDCVCSSWLMETRPFDDAGYRHEVGFALGRVIRNGFDALGHKVEFCNVMVSAPRKFHFEDIKELSHWERKMFFWNVSSEDVLPDWRIVGEHRRRRHFWAGSGVAKSVAPLEKMLRVTERTANPDGIAFVAEVHTKPFVGLPQSPIAAIWSECLGRRAIPFEPRARKALINYGRQHPELRRHIEVWEKLKSDGAKRTTQ